MLMESLNIVKIGGCIANDPDHLITFLNHFLALEYPKMLVHGGGSSASNLCRKLDIPVQMKNGRRITDKPSLDVAVMVYAGLINKNIVARLQGHSCNALGLSGADLNIIPAQKRNHPAIDYGFVGDITADSINTYFLSRLLDEQAVPVLSAITHDGKGQLLNTNADTVASTLARSMTKKYKVSLTYCFDKPGVLENIHDDDSWIKGINRQQYLRMKKDGRISKGMVPKLDTAFEALQNGIDSVHIKQAMNLTNKIGTTLTL